MEEKDRPSRRKNREERGEKKAPFGGLFTKDGATRLLGRLFAKKEKKTDADEKVKPDTVAGNGTVIQSKGALLGKTTAWILVAFVLAVSVLSGIKLLNPPAQANQVAEVKEDPTSQQAGDYARAFVGAWLRATRDDDSELSKYTSPEQGEITAREPTKVRSLGVASTVTGAEEISTVIVSAEVMRAPSKGAEKGTWVPAWYQVNIHHAESRFTPLGWPAPIPTPSKGTAPQLAYSYEASKEISSTIDAFFKAYALGEGDVSRITHPDAHIRALGENPYSSVKVTEVTTEDDFQEEIPADGVTTSALIQVSLGTGEDTSRAATYALTLETRGGRWEVRAIDTSPVLSAAKAVEEDQEDQSGEPNPSPSTETEDAPASE